MFSNALTTKHLFETDRQPNHLSPVQVPIDYLLSVAELAKAPNFDAIMYPFNPLETSSRYPSKQPQYSLQNVAKRAGLMQLGVRPLSAILDFTDLFTNHPLNENGQKQVGQFRYRFHASQVDVGAGQVQALNDLMNGTLAMERDLQQEIQTIKDETLRKELQSMKGLVLTVILSSNVSRFDLETLKELTPRFKTALQNAVTRVTRELPRTKSLANNYYTVSDSPSPFLTHQRPCKKLWTDI